VARVAITADRRDQSAHPAAPDAARLLRAVQLCHDPVTPVGDVGLDEELMSWCEHDVPPSWLAWLPNETNDARLRRVATSDEIPISEATGLRGKT
jgi:hypothetical protein